ncbi:hepatic leukemia factor-like [Argiope bruennichi]|uniref:Hepatic leukemia factor like protein n=1 Tax=Argiope bruennichi TaxID=94029 RepID=A0A8T0F3E4_ARGBR|nr:hepatic leukemia factor-like [Argiope bruennichi]KAF8785706.1 Hepatic leukemia factor like protein [Argiope bruennichi]
MDGMNMDQDFNVCRMTLQNILQTRDLSHPLQVNQVGKDDKDYTEICPDASAAFLGPNLWDEYKTAFIDLDSVLGNSPDNGIHSLENLEHSINENGQQQLQITAEENSNVLMPGVCSGEQSPMCSPAQSDTNSMQSFSDVPEKRSRSRSYSIDCKFSPSDLALATPPGHKHYDPASTVFPEEELKPQPIIKKSRKNFVPDNLKDDKYWARRHKNNIAAKRSREARRLKENQIVLRASYLEKENNSLKEDVIRLQAENDMLKEKIRKYES